MAEIMCPNCGRRNEEHTLICDCGEKFSSNGENNTRLSEKREKNKRQRKWFWGGGFFGWFLIGNLSLFALLILTPKVLPFLFEYFVIGIITIMVIVILFVRERSLLAYGIITAVITNAAGWFTITGYSLQGW